MAFGTIFDRKKPKDTSSEYLAAMRPLIKQTQEREAQKNKQMTFLETIADILSRGQYAVANTAQDIIKLGQGQEANPLEGLWKGITGERKGDWKTVLFGGQDPGSTAFSGIFQNTPDWMNEKIDMGFLGKWNAKDAVGFIADVFLDPLNIAVAPTRLGKAAAAAFAQKAVFAEIKNKSVMAELFKLTRGVSETDKIEALMKTNPDQALAKIFRDLPANSDMAKHINNTYKKAYHAALTQSPAKLKAEYIERLDNFKNQYIDKTATMLAEKGPKEAQNLLNQIAGNLDPEYARRLAEMASTGATKEDFKMAYKQLLSTAGGMGKIENVSKNMSTVLGNIHNMAREQLGVEDLFGKELKGLGERSKNYLFWDFGKKTYEQGPVAKTFTMLADNLAKTAPGSALGKAVEAITTKGPIGWLRQAFGIRNPYQQMIHSVELAHGKTMRRVSEDLQREVVKQFGPTVDKDLNDLYDVLVKLEEEPELADFTDPNSLAKLGIKPEEANRYATLTQKYKDFMHGLLESENEWNRKLGLPETAQREYYLPAISKTPGPIMRKGTVGTKPSFTYSKEYLTKERQDQQISKFMNLFGLDEATAAHAVKDLNWSTLNTNLIEMMLTRSYMHARFIANAQFIDSVRQFGFKFKNSGAPGVIKTTFDEADPVELQNKRALFEGINSRAGDLGELGLTKIDHPVLGDYYFDKEVGKVIENVGKIFYSDEAMSKLSGVIGNAVSWWRGMATLTPGFHIRNAKNNTWNDFLLNGFDAFNLAEQRTALAGVAYGLYGDKIFESKIAKALGILHLSPDKLRIELNKQWCGKPLKEWVEKARQEELIGRVSQGFNAEEMAKSMTEKPSLLDQVNVLGKKNALFKGSREIGSIIESVPKFHSYLSQMKRMSGGIDKVATDAVEQAAMANTVKYFFDYSDLTHFEKGIRDTFIPFYTWLRKNIALQLTTMFENRAKLAIAIKAQNEKWNPEVNREDLYPYVRELGGIAVGKKGENVEVEFPQLGYVDINKIPLKFQMDKNGIPAPVWDPGGIMDEFLSMSHPMVKTLVSIMGSPQGYDPFRKRDLDSKSPAPRVMRLFAINPRVMEIADAMVKGFGYDKGLGVEKDPKTGKLMIDAKIAYVLEANFPLFQRIDQLGDAFVSVLPQIEEEMAKATGYSAGVDDVNRRLKTASFLLGSSEREYDLDKIALARYREYKAKAEKALEETRRQQPGYTRRQEEYYKREARQLRRLGLQ